MLHAWKSDGTSLSALASGANVASRHNSHAKLVPGRHEEEVMGQTLDVLPAKHTRTCNHRKIVTTPAPNASPGRLLLELISVVDHSVRKK
jgi:hypothetical protein